MPDHDQKESSRSNNTKAQPVRDEVEEAIHEGDPRGDIARLVNTTWLLDYESVEDGNGRLSPRSDGTAMYVDLAIDPATPAGSDSDKYHRSFNGVVIKKVGAAHLGTVPLPVGSGGTISANVAYGARPTFDFTIQSADPEVRARAKNEHGKLVGMLAAGLDDFVDASEPQRVLNQLLEQQFPNKLVTGTIIQKANPKMKRVASMDYAPLAGPRTFELGIEIPKKAYYQAQTHTDTHITEDTKGTEHTTGTADESEATSSSAIENTHVENLTSILRTGFKQLADKIRKLGLTGNRTLTTVTGTDTATKTGFKILSDIAGSGEMGLDIAGLKIGKAALNFAIHPGYSTDVDVTTKGSDTDAINMAFARDRTTQDQVARSIDTEGQRLTSTTFKTTIMQQLRSKTSSSTGDKDSSAGKVGGTTTDTVAHGSVEVMKDGEARLVEKKR